MSADEYTIEELAKRYGAFDAPSVSYLSRLPCVFAYEAFNNIHPRFGLIRDIVKRQGLVRVEYELRPCDPFLSSGDLENMKFELDIGKWELNRTHWAVKEVNLPKELKAKGVHLPEWANDIERAVDITSHQFEVALSFPGEIRNFVEQVAAELEAELGPNSYFYDHNYVSQLARPGLDLLLQGIYRDRSRLVVVFLSGDYQRKDWCGVEFRAIRDIIHARDHQRVMFVRTDQGEVEGVFNTDGFVDAQRFGPREIARFIRERVSLLH